ncbi:MAG: DUF1289 domain-containing protein [Nitrosomonadales bacterium]|nr:DUF1289 domain-containing protein [Nitrosomonadales bacterium]
MTDTDFIVESPCVDNCRLNEQGICLGCFLSREEIDGWNRASNQDRMVMLRNASQRQQTQPETTR